MMNNRLINESMEKLQDFYDAEGIMETNSQMLDKLIEWYSNTDIADSNTLAAAALLGDYSMKYSMDEIISMRDNYFPYNEDLSIFTDLRLPKVNEAAIEHELDEFLIACREEDILNAGWDSEDDSDDDDDTWN